jgi:hypothetical protein
MVELKGYKHFSGRHWETGSVHNYYAYRGVKAPHTGEPYSEALLLGVSGGIVMGYFSFAYEGYDPHVAILTRNTFDPLDTLLERLGVEQEVLQTGKPERGLANLVDTLESGLPAITWVDIFSLPYFELPNEDDMYLMYPLVVYGYDESAGEVLIADRSRAPLKVTPAQLAAARARVKKDKFRVMTLGEPDPHKLGPAVSKGIWDTIKLFTEAPPRGSRHNFGFAAYERWADLLVKPKIKNSWAEVFPPGRAMIAGLTSAFYGTIQNGEGDGAERSTYADFLDEAAPILDKPGLRDAAERFRESAEAWKALGCALLPDELQPLGKIRERMLRRRQLFLDQGGAAADEISRINQEIRELKAEAAGSLFQSEDELSPFMENLRGQILAVRDIEVQAVQALQGAMTG